MRATTRVVALCTGAALAACASGREVPGLGSDPEPSEAEGARGGDSGAGPAGGSGQGDDAPRDPPLGALPDAAPSVPPDATADAPKDAPVAITRAGDAFFAVSASGEVLLELPAFDAFQQLRPMAYVEIQTRGEHVLIARAECHEPSALDPNVTGLDAPPGSCRHYAMLLRRDGLELLWQRKSELLAVGAVARLGESGAVSLAEVAFEPFAWRTVVIDTSGQEHVFAGTSALSAPDRDGFVAVLRDTDSLAGDYGFVAPGAPAVQPLSVPMLPWGPAAQDAVIRRGPQVDGDAGFTYLGVDDRGGPLLVHERPRDVARVELPAPSGEELELMIAAHAWMLVAFDREAFTRRPWRSVTRDGHEVLSPSLPEGFAATDVELPHGDWLRVSDQGEAYGWLDASTGRWKAPPPAPEGQRRFSTGENCDSTDFVTEDGQALVHLRDDVVGHAYLEAEDGVLQALGTPIVDAVYVATARVAETFEIRPLPRDATYCPEPVWPATPPAGELLRGGQVQYLRGERSLVVEDPLARTWLSPNGRFVAVRQLDQAPVLHDLTGGRSVTLTDMDAFEGWL